MSFEFSTVEGLGAGIRLRVSHDSQAWKVDSVCRTYSAVLHPVIIEVN